jgi:hypothetical protein
VTPGNTGPHHVSGTELLSRVQPWGVPIQGGTLALLISAIFMAKGALESALEASETATAAVNELRADLTGIRTDVSTVKRMQQETAKLADAIDLIQAADKERAMRIDRELADIRKCLATRKRRDCEDL